MPPGKVRYYALWANQQGVGKGLMTVDNVDVVHGFMIREVENNGGKIDKTYFCPQLKSAPDNYRKPNPAMAFFAKNDFPDIDFSKSIIADK